MTGLPSVTVLVTTYNRAQLLPASLDSALAQDYPNLRVLVVDDGSTDETPDLLAAYARRYPRLLRWVRQENAGQARAVNRGFAEIDSDFVSLLADDDDLLPEAIGRLARALEERPDAVVAYGDYCIVGAAGSEVTTVRALEWDLPRILELHECTIGPGVLVRRCVVDRAGGWDPRFRYEVDFEFWLRLGLHGGFVRVPEVVSRWRHHDMSITTTQRGPEVAGEPAAIIEKFYSLPDVPPEALAVRGRAFRNAHFRAAILCEHRHNQPGERYLIEDTLPQQIFVTDAEPAPAGTSVRYEAELRRAQDALRTCHEDLRARSSTAEALHHEAEALHAEVAVRDAAIAQLHAEVANRDAEIVRLHAQVADA